jgi:hypothetical protein
MSNTSHRDTADHTNLSTLGKLGGSSADATSIPVLDSPANRRSDSEGPIAGPLAIAPPARTSRRGFLMNTMVSAASLSTATVVATPAIATAPDNAVSFPELVARFVPLHERCMKIRADMSRGHAEEDIAAFDNHLTSVVTHIVSQPAKSLCDLGWQAQAIVTWDRDLGAIDDSDYTDDRLLKTFLANVRSLAGPLHPGIVPAESADPIFAAIEAHRGAHADVTKAANAADEAEDEAEVA